MDNAILYLGPGSIFQLPVYKQVVNNGSHKTAMWWVQQEAQNWAGVLPTDLHNLNIKICTLQGMQSYK